ncbi:shikimate kinase [Pseudobutyrivibrio ruminis]|uniref:shikimate kinase n=1 Tax=Pseudobutyrivibrio ruminis TaxID=46206 RepID=UPI00041066A7|nr:shikimate kinase [Pseudobutyrivibrio ruminis]
MESVKALRNGKSFDYNIVLIGFMGTGKSTIAECLSNCFDMKKVEMDQEIVNREGMSIADIFSVHGEEYFRDAETNLLKEMQSEKNVVISCGGGTPLRDVNVQEMKKNGKVVLLTAKPETIYERVKDDHDRPLLENNKSAKFIEDMLLKRQDKYLAAADIIVETDGKSKLEICKDIVSALTALEK